MWIVYAICGLILIFGFVVFRGAPYVPTHRKYAREALKKLYKINSDDVLVDLGSGDGYVLRVAAENGATAVGYELNPLLVLMSCWLSRKQPRVSTRLADMWLVNFPEDTTVFYIFAVSRDIEKITDKVQQFVNDRGEAVWIITYGINIPSHKPVKKLKAHELYRIKPLQS